MTGPEGEIARLFAAPGGSDAGAATILRETASAHRELLDRALCDVGPRCCPALPLVSDLLSQENRNTSQRFLADSVLTEGLHELVPCSTAIRAWHNCTADPVSHHRDRPATSPRCVHGMTLGNAALSLVLRAAPHWCGALRLRTDCFGFLRFPLSDWSLSLTTSGPTPCMLSEEPVCLRLNRNLARFSIVSEGEFPVLSMPRGLLLRLIVHNDLSAESRGLIALDPTIKSRWQHATPLCPGGARFLPIHCTRDGSRADRCGGVVRQLHDLLEHASPVIHREFCRLVDAVHGYDLPGRADGVVQSFSEPTRPRLVGFNVPFTDSGAPCGDPFAVTCLGHEMAHSKMYLIGSIGWHHGWWLVNNPDVRTGVLPRYGRSLGVRTLFQIPYTHLYEWTILTDVCAAGWDGASLQCDAPLQFGNDLRDEIIEAFDTIDEFVDLTPAGTAALVHFRGLFEHADRRWRRLWGRRAGRAVRKF